MQVPDKLEYFDEVCLHVARCMRAGGLPKLAVVQIKNRCMLLYAVPAKPWVALSQHPSPLALPWQVTYRPDLLPAAGPFELHIRSQAPFLGDKVGGAVHSLERCVLYCGYPGA